jgi:hypothetical protein
VLPCGFVSAHHEYAICEGATCAAWTWRAGVSGHCIGRGAGGATGASRSHENVHFPAQLCLTGSLTFPHESHGLVVLFLDSRTFVLHASLGSPLLLKHPFLIFIITALVDDDFRLAP